MSIYQFSLPLIGGVEKSMNDYRGQVLLIVNTATKCGFSGQLKELQDLYSQYKNYGFQVLAFPCNQFMNQEPGTNDEILEVCQTNFRVDFPLFEKIYVKGKNTHPLYIYLTNEEKGFLTSSIKWNFTKFLIDRQGKVFKRYAPMTAPSKIETGIQKLLSKKNG